MPDGDTPDTTPIERESRAQQRTRTLKGADIVLGPSAEGTDPDPETMIPVLVRDLSDNGAKIELARTVELPQSFALRFHDGDAHRAEIAWQDGQMVGLRFPEAIANPVSRADIARIAERLAEIEGALAELRQDLRALF